MTTRRPTRATGVASAMGWCALFAAIAASQGSRAEAPSASSRPAAAEAGPGAARSAAPYLLVSVVVGAAPPDRVERRLRASLVGTPVPVLGGVDGAARLEAAHSSEPSALGEDVLARWASRSRAALRHLARGEYDAAREALLEAQAISTRAADALNRESSRARQVLDTCLFDVRAALETGAAAEAEAKAFDCRRLVPRMQPSSYMHTPEVRALVERVDATLERERAGALSVRSAPSGCAVRVNGVPFGATPLETRELPRGRYRVQVECEDGRQGRVHGVELGERDLPLEVDVDAERALHTRPFVSLHYASRDDAARRAARDAQRLARALASPVLLGFVADDHETVTLQHVPARGAPHAPRPLAAFVAEAPFETATAGDSDLDTPADDGVDRVVTTLASVSASAFGVGVGLAGARARLRGALLGDGRTQQGYLDRRGRTLRLGITLPVLAGVAAPLASAAAVRGVRRAAHPRRVAGWLGAGGLTLAGAATVVAVRAPRCYGAPPCLARDPSTDAATLLASAAIPLLSAPLGLLGRADDGPTLALQLEPGRVGLSVSGAISSPPRPRGSR